jgi:hypothetical protein
VAWFAVAPLAVAGAGWVVTMADTVYPPGRTQAPVQGPSAAEPPVRRGVFVSHHPQDQFVADAIVARLEQAGIRCWAAPRDLSPGQNWARDIDAAVAACRVMVVVLSPASVRSPQVLLEVEQAVAAGRVVIAFRIEPVAMPDALASHLLFPPGLDAFHLPLDARIVALTEVVASGLRGRSAEPWTPPPGASGTRGATPGHRRRGWRVAGVVVGVVGGLLLATMLVVAAVDLFARLEPFDPDTSVVDETEIAEGGPSDPAAETDIVDTRADRPGDLLEACEADDRAACTDLYWESPYGGEQEALALDRLWRFFASEELSIDLGDDPSPTGPGSNAEFDARYEACEAAEEATCRRLLWQSPVFSEYQELAYDALDLDPDLVPPWEVEQLKTIWLTFRPSDRAFECAEFRRWSGSGGDPWMVEDSVDAGLTREVVLMFYEDTC